MALEKKISRTAGPILGLPAQHHFVQEVSPTPHCANFGT
jgi:hypothetical protein